MAKKPAPPEEKGFWQGLAERFFPPATLGAGLREKTKKGRQTPPSGRRRPPSGAPIDMMGDEKKKKTKSSEGYYDAAGTR